jgi:hypothetical protein
MHLIFFYFSHCTCLHLGVERCVTLKVLVCREKMGVETGWVMCIDFVPRKVKIFSLGPGFQLLI